LDQFGRKWVKKQGEKTLVPGQPPLVFHVHTNLVGEQYMVDKRGQQLKVMVDLNGY
jgi:hypothetical protein